jgi:transmembrane sensor
LKENDLNKIERYIRGVADENEKAQVESLLLNGEENYTLRIMLEKDWDEILRDSSLSDTNLSHLLDRIHHIIRKKEQQRKKTLFHRFTRVYMKAAALLLIPLLIAGVIGYIYLDKQSLSTSYQPDSKTIDQLVKTSIIAPLGARVSFNLPDGTNGMLNSGSRLTYSLPFNNNRQVILEGEAWFEVNRDKEYPFEISTGNSTVKVLGTSFNMSAYTVENYVEVVLQHGKVEFQDNTGDEMVTMYPSERLVFENGNISKSVADPAKYNAWTEGKLVFRGDPMTEVCRRIERWYNVKVELNDKELEKYSFRATFEDEKLEEVLRLLSMTSPISYQIIPRKLLNDGTYEKVKVTIFLKK